MKAISSSEVKKKDKLVKEHFKDCYSHLVHKSFMLNISTFEKMAFKAMSVFMSKKMVKKMNLLGKDFHKTLDKEIGLSRLPTSIGGSNPTALKDYINIFDEELEASYQECRLGLTK